MPPNPTRAGAKTNTINPGLPEPIGLPEPVLAPSQRPPRRQSRRLWIGLAIPALLLLGLAAFVLMRVNWGNLNPWQRRPIPQRTVLIAIADSYWETSNLDQAKKMLTGWDRQDVAGLLAALQRDTPDPETRKHLGVLAVALGLPTPEASLLSLIAAQPSMGLGILLAIMPFVGAFAVLAAPALRQAVATAPRLLNTVVTHAAQADEAMPTELAIQRPAAEESPGVINGEFRDEEPAAELKADEPKKEELEDSELEEEEEVDAAEAQDALFQDLASVFEEEDASISSLETLCKDLPDPDMDELVETSKTVLHSLAGVELERWR